MYCLPFKAYLVTYLSEVQIVLTPKAWLNSLHLSQLCMVILCLTLDGHENLGYTKVPKNLLLQSQIIFVCNFSLS